MTKVVKSSALVATSLWVGMLFCLGFVVAPYIFTLAGRKSTSVPNTGVAADLIGPLLYGSDVMGLFVGVLLVGALVFLRFRGEVPLGSRFFLSEVGLLLAMGCAAVNYWLFAPRLRTIQALLAERYGAFHQAQRADPLFQQFSSLHQASTTVFMLGFLAAFIVLISMTQFRLQRAPSATPEI